MKLLISDFFPAVTKRSFRHFLLYGNQEMIVQGLLEELEENTPLSFCQAQEFFQSPELWTCQSLFQAGPTLTVVTEITEKSFSVADSFLKNISNQSMLIFTSTELRSQSSWVQHFQKSPHLAAISCYEASIPQSREILARLLKGVTIPLTWQNELAQWTQDGSWMCKSKTLKLYLESCSNNLLSKNIDFLFNTLPYHDVLLPFQASTGTFLKSIQHLDDTEKLKIIKGWQRLAVQLCQLKSMYNPKEDLAKLCLQVKPTIFFKHIPLITKHFHQWSSQWLVDCLDALFEAEMSLKNKLYSSQDLAVFHKLSCLSNA
jgi:DNA polymerase III delta subunit